MSIYCFSLSFFTDNLPNVVDGDDFPLVYIAQKSHKTKSPKTLTKTAKSHSKKPSKVCRVCPYAHCCQSCVTVHKNRRHDNPPQPVSMAMLKQMEKFIDVLLHEMDSDPLEIAEDSDNSDSESESCVINSSNSTEEASDATQNLSRQSRSRQNSCSQSVPRQRAMSWAYEGESAF